MKYYYTLIEIEDAYRYQYPNLAEAEIREKAKRIHSQLNTLDIRWRRSNKRYYKMQDLQNIVL